MGKTFSFVSGALFGAAAGAIIGVALAPRSGAETRAMLPISANGRLGQYARHLRARRRGGPCCGE